MTSRRDFLKTVGVGSAALAIQPHLPVWSAAAHAQRPPNIILIFTDDQGYADVGCYGAKGFTTPNLDRMASEGIRFTNFYVSQAVCSASRASLLTGCYSERVSIQGALMPWATIGLNTEEETIAEILKKSGYATGMVGKWHLGHHKEFLPLRHGFDEYLGLPYSNDMWPVDFDGTPITKGPKLRYPPLPLIDGDEKVDEIRTLDDQANLTTRYTERAVQFIEKNKEQPFFLYVAHSMPHVPLGVSSKFKGKSQQGMYGDVIMEIDWSVGEILKTLAKHELEEKTLVMFMSDNGPWLNFGNHGGSAQPLREGKGTMWEGGARVPCMMRWPGQIPTGRTTDKIAATIDILPTIAAITGAPLPEKPIDGVNIAPLLKGASRSNPRDHYFYYYGGGLCAVREGKWKLLFPHNIRSYENKRPGMNGFPGETTTKNVGLELYNLEDDIGEQYNVVIQQPEVVTRLQRSAEKIRKELGDQFTKRIGNNVRPPGRLQAGRSTLLHHLAVGASVSLTYASSPRYASSSAQPLVDGMLGSLDHADGFWQGFEGVDLEAIVDLKRVLSVEQVLCSFLQSQGSWVFLPEEVEYALSEDGNNFKIIPPIREPILQTHEIRVKEYNSAWDAVKARFIRVRAKNIGICPEWHAGAGGKAWLFLDEIVVR